MTFWLVYVALPAGKLQKEEIVSKENIRAETSTDESCRPLTLMSEHRPPGEHDKDATAD